MRKRQIRQAANRLARVPSGWGKGQRHPCQTFSRHTRLQLPRKHARGCGLHPQNKLLQSFLTSFPYLQNYTRLFFSHPGCVKSQPREAEVTHLELIQQAAMFQPGCIWVCDAEVPACKDFVAVALKGVCIMH